MATTAQQPDSFDAGQGPATDHSATFGAEIVDQVLSIPTAMIDRGERLRPIDPTWASALGLIMLKEGQNTPVEVYRLPGSNRWTLNAGGHRHAGAELEGIEYLRAIVVSANRDDRRMREVSENLWRRDLEPIDRAAFIAEAVMIHRRRAGLQEADHRLKSVAKRWQQEISDEVDQTMDTMSNVYGWSDEVGDQLGLSARTVRRDLLIYRRIAPSLIARLRDARHPVATNATQLRALAKLEDSQQTKVVDLLVWPGASLNYGVPKTVAEAIAHPLGPKPSRPKPAEDKRLSAFIGAFQRMSLTEKKGALDHLLPLLPAGTMLTNLEQKARFSPQHVQYREESLEAIDAAREAIDALLEDEIVDGDRREIFEKAGSGLAITRVTIAGNGFELGDPA